MVVLRPMADVTAAFQALEVFSGQSWLGQCRTTAENFGKVIGNSEQAG